MARPIYKYQPINENPDISIGVMLPFNKAAAHRSYSMNYISGSAGTGGGVFAVSYTTEEQALSNFKNLLLTTKGERYMQPNFGSSIRNLLFENNTAQIKEFLEEELKRDIEVWLPYIRLNQLVVKRDPDQHTLRVQIHFRIVTNEANLVINVLANENELSVSPITEAAPTVQGLVQVDSFGGGGLGGGGFVGGY
jgi:phage baseplate assembly protein W